MPEDKAKQFVNLINKMEGDLKALKKLAGEIESGVDFKELPGVTGIFDGEKMVGDDGKKYDVPVNYAAKSRLISGDKLKLVEHDGKKLFKQVKKVPRKKVEGIVTKKEKEWYVLTEVGSHKISRAAAEFNKISPRDKVTVVIPLEGNRFSFAALDKVFKEKRVEKVPNPVVTKKAPKTVVPKAPVKKTTVPKATVEKMFDDDDLR